MLRFEIHRNHNSWHYKVNKAIAPSWTNNRANNSLDLFILFDREEAIWHTNCQTISNCEGIIDGARFIDTLVAGKMAIKAFVDPRLFHGRIHGITSARTIAGELVRSDSTTRTNQARWLMHDWQKHKPSGPGQDTSVAWSAGCVVMPTQALAELGGIFDEHGIKPGDEITGELFEEAI
jgi:hypothetical protein